jgi:hypothetical protein
MALTLDGTNGITFNNSTVQASAGSVLQVVNATTSTTVTTTSTSVVTTNFSASITPKFATSKILVVVSCATCVTSNGAGVVLQLYRGGSSVFNINPVGNFINTGTSVAQLNQQTTQSYLDSPATTSATTYTIYFATFGPYTAYFSVNANPSTITLMEIAG